MEIPVVRPGETLYGISAQYGVPMSRLISDNMLPDPSRLVTPIADNPAQPARRSEMRKAGVEYVVLKNGIVERAAAEAGIDASINAFLKGPSAFAFGYEDAVAPAKILKETVKKLKKCEIKCGIVNGVVSDAKAVDTLAELPSREQLLSRLLGSMLSPISGLAIVLDQIAKKLGEDAPAEAAE